MSSTYTSRLRLEKQTTGENSNTWGTRLNEGALDMLDQAIAGFTSIALTDSSRTISTANGVTDEARAAIIQLSGTLTSSVDVVIPAVSKDYVVRNATSGAFTVTMKVAGTGVALPQGATSHIFTDGVTVRSAWGTGANFDVGTGDSNIPQVSVADKRYIRASVASTIKGKKTFSSATTFSGPVSASSRMNVILSTTLQNLRVDGTSNFTTVVNVSGPSRTPILTLTDAASIKVSLERGNYFQVTLAGNRTLENPKNSVAGQSGLIYVFQDATGTRTLSFGDAYRFSGGTAPTLSTSVNSVDVLAYNVRGVSVIDMDSKLDMKA
jgi:hypothetical protein